MKKNSQSAPQSPTQVDLNPIDPNRLYVLVMPGGAIGMTLQITDIALKAGGMAAAPAVDINRMIGAQIEQQGEVLQQARGLAEARELQDKEARADKLKDEAVDATAAKTAAKAKKS